MDIIVPKVGESITEVQVAQWLKAEGDSVRADEPVVVVDSEKATLEVPAPAAGMLGKILRQRGETVKVGEVLGTVEPGRGDKGTGRQGEKAKSSASFAPSPPPPVAQSEGVRIMPAARRALAEAGLEAKDVQATGPGGRILKEDVERRSGQERRAASASAEPQSSGGRASASADSVPAPAGTSPLSAGEEAVPLSPMRKMIAKRLVQAQSEMALLSTFNEIDMSAVMDLRKNQGESFLAKHGVKLGFMSFFVKAAVEGLKKVPQLNAELRGEALVYKNRYDIGVAVGGGKGLVVPVIRGAETLSFAEIEKSIADFGARAQAGKIAPAELRDGTFTISNGGVYGSLLSTPIVNPPQSGILGLHAIQDRPVARDGQVVIRPMMYAALTYDHRVVDGREAVTFLKTIKDIVEKPSVMLLEI